MDSECGIYSFDHGGNILYVCAFCTLRASGCKRVDCNRKLRVVYSISAAACGSICGSYIPEIWEKDEVPESVFCCADVRGCVCGSGIWYAGLGKPISFGFHTGKMGAIPFAAPVYDF